jgi:aryl-alcohol dehydrogenase-like predicted oxidoreductase
VLPIPGTTAVPHLVENLAASAVELTAGQLARLDGWHPGHA